MEGQKADSAVNHARYVANNIFNSFCIHMDFIKSKGYSNSERMAIGVIAMGIFLKRFTGDNHLISETLKALLNNEDISPEDFLSKHGG